MKKILLFSIATFLLFLIGCDETFDPRGEYDERYSLNCIVRSDTNLQIVTTFISYDVPGMDPYENIKYPFIEGAFIRMWQGDDVYIFRDSMEARVDTSRYKSPRQYYYIDNFVAKENQPLEIEALLPNGRRLKAETKVPQRTTKDFNTSDSKYPVEGKNTLTMAWNSDDPEAVFLPIVELYYSQNINGAEVRKIQEIPLDLVSSEGQRIEIFPEPSRDISINIPSSIIDEYMAKISEGNDKKSDYTIYTIIVSLLTFDKNLSGYYSSVSKIDDSFSVRLDELDFSNIEGGFGIFGTYMSSKMVTFFEKEYIEQFGYRVGIEL